MKSRFLEPLQRKRQVVERGSKKSKVSEIGIPLKICTCMSGFMETVLKKSRPSQTFFSFQRPAKSAFESLYGG